MVEVAKPWADACTYIPWSARVVEICASICEIIAYREGADAARRIRALNVALLREHLANNDAMFAVARERALRTIQHLEGMR